jgi:hypothetical protein
MLSEHHREGNIGVGLPNYRANVSRKIIKEMWPNHTAQEIAERLGANASYIAKVACGELGLKKHTATGMLKANIKALQEQIADKDAQIASLQQKLAAGCSITSTAKAKPPKPAKMPYAGFDPTEESQPTGRPIKSPPPPPLQNGMIGASLSDEQQAELRRKLA